MNNYYFSYGSDERFPYGMDDVTLVKAESMKQAIAIFCAVHEKRDGCVNCASYYTEEEYKKTCMYNSCRIAETLSLNIER